METILAWIGNHHDALEIILLFGGGLWALLIYRRDRRVKAADYLLQLETKYVDNLDTLLDLESTSIYKEQYREAIRKSLYESNPQYTNEETKAISRIEKAFRHFLTAAHLRNLRIDAGILDQSYKYYLNKYLTSTDHEYLADYIKRYWRALATWQSELPISQHRATISQARNTFTSNEKSNKSPN